MGRKTLISCLLLALLAAFSTDGLAEEKGADERMAREAEYLKCLADARQALEAGELEKACEKATRAIALKPGDQDALEVNARCEELGLARYREEAKAAVVPTGFEAPDALKDRLGNPVVSRDRRRADPATKDLFEIRLRLPGSSASAGRESVFMEFVLVPAGEFEMGSPDSDELKEEDEGPVHRVRFAKPFYIGKYEVTQGQWKAVMGSNPSIFTNAGRDAPVEQVSWDDCHEFINKLNAFAGATHASPLRLPSEAEWEYACRAGTKTALYTGPLTIRGRCNAPELDEISWYCGNSGVAYEGGFDSSRWPGKQYEHTRAGTHPVGKKKPNAWSLYDTIGNVSEWCEDVWHENYAGAPADGSAVTVVEPLSPPLRVGIGSGRVVRGGSWRSFAGDYRSACRGMYGPLFINVGVGFRLAVGPRIP